jgi:hypothetical protein
MHSRLNFNRNHARDAYAASVIGDEELAEDRQHKRPPAAVAPAFAPRPRDIRCQTRTRSAAAGRRSVLSDHATLLVDLPDS